MELQQDRRRAVSVKEFAETMGVSLNHVYNEIRSGGIRSFRLGRKHLIPTSEIDRFLGDQPSGEAA